MMIQISIIIPVYKVEPYIRRCLQSVLSQTYENIECIIVNDATPDKSMEIVDEVLKDYNGAIKFKVIHHEKNRGLSAARNSGVRAATGDYLFFLDSDDELPSDSIKNFVQYLNKYGDADFLIGNYIVEGNFQYIPLATPVLLEGHDNIMQAYLKGDWYMMACGKLINRVFFEGHDLWFAEKRLHEDDLFSFQLALKASKMITLQENVYKYIIRSNSITTAKQEKNYVDMFWIIRQKMELIERSKGIISFSLSYYIVSMLFQYSIFISVSQLEYRKKISFLKRGSGQLNFINCKNGSFKMKVEYLILSFPPFVIVCFGKLINKIRG